MQYATPLDYFAFTTGKASIPPGTDIDQVNADLRRASGRIHWAIRFGRYAIDRATGMPTSPRILQALRDATCAELNTWKQTGDDGSGVASGFDTFTAAGVTLSTRLSSTGTVASNVDGISAEAARIIAAAGILTSHVRSL